MDDKDLIGRTIAGYRLLRVLGKGEISTVFLGQRSDQILMAIKVLNSFETLPSETHAFYKASFLSQVRKVQQLRHKHIVPILDYGETEGCLYMVLPVFSGGTLSSRLTTQQGLLPLDKISKYMNQLASALDYAHQNGVIHGDINPRNMLFDLHENVYLTNFGVIHPFQKVFDTFDLVAGSSAASTITRKMFSSPAYMAPEQFRGEKAGMAADIYALGVMLYLLVTNKLPFEADDPIVMGMKHVEEAPLSPRIFRPELSDASNAAILHALTKGISDRFTSAGALVQAFEESLNGQWTQELLQSSTVKAEQSKIPAKTTLTLASSTTSQSARAARPISRRSFVFSLTGIILAAGVGGSTLFALSQRKSAPSTPSSHATASTNTFQRGAVIFTYHGHAARVGAVVWSPDGKRIASAGNDKIVQVCDGTTGITELTYHGHAAEVYTVAWSPDGRLIASAGADQQVHVWNANTGKHILTYKGHTDQINALSWSPDSRHVASASDDHTAQVWNALTGKQSLVYGGHSSGVLAVAWSPDGKRIASGSWDTTVQIWDPTTRKTSITYHGHSAEVYAISWSPNGKYMASGGSDTIVHTWNAASGSTIFTYRGHSDVVLAAAWSPDGKQIASAGYDNTVQIWNAPTGNRILSYHGHANWVDSVVWQPDSNQHIASASYDNTVQVWQAA